MADKVGVFNRLGWDDDSTTATLEFEFLEGSTLGLAEQFIDTNGLRGTRSHTAARVRRGNRRVDGNLNFAPNAKELDKLLELALGGTKSGGTIPLAEALPSTNWLAVRDGTVYSYSGCVVETLEISASEGGPLTVGLSVVGRDEAITGSMGSVAPDDTTGGPFTLMDGVVTVGGTEYQFSQFSLRVENRLEVKYRNSLTPTQIRPTDRMVTVSLPFSLGDAGDLYGSAVGGVAVVATFTNGTVSVSFSLAAVQAPKSPLPFGQRGILDLPWQGVARRTSGALELVTTVDSTP